MSTEPTHLALPFRVTASGRLAAVEQDSAAELSQSIALLVSTRPGERRCVEDYGVPDPVFGGVDADVIAQAVATWEERADSSDVEHLAQSLVDDAVVVRAIAQPDLEGDQ